MHILVDELRYPRLDKPFVNDFKPYGHQDKTLKAVRAAIAQNKTVCVLNSSATGSGKTLANFAASILDGVPTIGVYPTNELIRDQEGALLKHLSRDEIIRVDSNRLDHWQDIMQTRGHTEALHEIMAVWEDTRAILTNPDILFLIAYDLFGYSRSVNYRERLFQALLNNYPIIAFDEFHLYDTKQVGNAAFIVGTMARLASKKPHVFIFSSATPKGIHQWAAQELGLEVVDVTSRPEVIGSVVSERLNLALISTNLSHWQGAKTIIESTWPQIEEYLAQYPAARGVFILDSVYEAKILAGFLAEKFGKDQVGEVHGYMDATARQDSLERRFSVGTTTIDVGVDLTGNKAKEFIVFEARSAAQANQRLGRLGREGRDAGMIAIPNRAWALVPPYVYSYVQAEMVEWNLELPGSRPEILSIIESAYTMKEEFHRYWNVYSPYEAIAAKERIKLSYLSGDYEATDEQLRQVIRDLYQPNETLSILEEDQRDLWHQFGQAMDEQNKHPSRRDWYLPELESFRGSSYLQVALYDKLDEQRGWFPFKIYNLPFVLRRTVFRKLGKSQFESLVKDKGGERADGFLRRVERSNVLGYLQIEGTAAESNPFCFEIPYYKLRFRHEQLLKLKGIEITIDDQRQLHLVNKRLKKQSLIAWYYQGAPWDLADTYNLPVMFQIYPLRAIGGNGRPIHQNLWSVVYGLNAFLISTVPKPTDSAYFS